MNIKRVTVFGGGTLGAQAALQFALYGKQVTVLGRSDNSLEKALSRIRAYSKKYEEETSFTAEEVLRAQESIKVSSCPKEALSGTDLVFECTSESREVKKQVLETIEANIDSDEVVVATNSSTLLPSSLVKYLKEGSRFLAIHLANEIWKRSTAEIMPHPGTKPELMDEVTQFVKEVGLTPVPLMKEQPGYILNSLMIPWLRAGLDLAAKGVASPKDIDAVWEAVMGSEGPFRVVDIVGLRTIVSVLSLEVEAGIEGSQRIIDYLTEAYISKGCLGVENGKGIYDYS